jgi:DNA-binding CsgD family transcriptional regulator
MINFKSYIINIFLLIILFTPVLSQFTEKSLIINYPKQEYQADNQNWSVAINTQGFVFSANNEGLLEFDGSEWMLWKMPDNMGVRSVAVSSDDRIYVGSNEEFGYWARNDIGLLNYTSLSDSIEDINFHNDEIWRIIPFEGKIYFQSFNTIFIYDGQNIVRIKPLLTLVLLIEARNRLFIHQVNKGLCEIINDQIQLVPEGDKFSKDEVKLVLPYGEKEYLIGTASGILYKYDGKHFEQWTNQVENLLKEADINTGSVIDSLIIIGTIVDGVFILNQEGKLIEHINTENYLQNNTILSICPDELGNFWLGLDRGIDYVRRDSPLDFYIDPSGNSMSVYSAALFNNFLWIGTNQGLMRYSFQDAVGYTDPIMIEGTQGQVWDLKVYDNQLFCGHTNGTFLIQNNQAFKICDINGGYQIKKIFRENKEYLLQSTYSSLVVYEKKDNKWNFSHLIQGFLEPIPHFEIDNFGNLWAQHNSRGLYKIKLNENLDSVLSINYFGKDQGFKNDRNIFVSQIENRIVFSTMESIYTYDDLNDTIIPYENLRSGLGEFFQAKRIIPASDHFYWFVKNNICGLFNINQDSINDFFQYDFGRQKNFLISSLPEIIKLKDKLHLICLDNGFALFNENRLKDYKTSTELKFREIKAGNSKGDYQLYTNFRNNKAEIPYQFHNIYFSCFAPYQSLYPLYRFRITGLENKWSGWQENPKISVTRIPPGNYKFEAQFLSIEGKLSDPAHFSFIVQRPWYGSKIFIIIYSLVIIFLIVLLRILFIQRLNKQTQTLKVQEKEKRQKEVFVAEQNLTRLKNEKLQSESNSKSFQLANYTMTILRKNELLIDLKNEINKQKDELGGRYPNFYYDRMIRIIDKNIESEDDWRIFEDHFDQAHENFFQRMKFEYPNLTPSDLRMSAYLRLNLSSKEIAPLLNISVRGVEIRRFRLRKRLNLITEENLVEFLLAF